MTLVERARVWDAARRLRGKGLAGGLAAKLLVGGASRAEGREGTCAGQADLKGAWALFPFLLNLIPFSFCFLSWNQIHICHKFKCNYL
jgi:hypothetical protein